MKPLSKFGFCIALMAAVASCQSFEGAFSVDGDMEAAKMAVKMMGATDLTKGKVMIVGATGSIASVCSRLLAQAIHDVVLVFAVDGDPAVGRVVGQMKGFFWRRIHRKRDPGSLSRSFQTRGRSKCICRRSLQRDRRGSA